MKNKKRTFKEAVIATPDISSHYKIGLLALVGDHSKKVIVGNTSLIDGSVDIDNATSTLYPNDNRWDYVIGYDGKVYFIEVHTANTREVSTMINKLTWLKDWLVHKAPAINNLRNPKEQTFFWIQSSNCQIPKTSRQYRIAATNGILPVRTISIR
jgi:hypothetical protein